MNPQIPRTDSIQELASFWQSHDLTEFDDQLEEVPEQVFESRNEGTNTVLQVPLTLEQAKALEHLALANGVDAVSLVQVWVSDHVSPTSS